MTSAFEMGYRLGLQKAASLAQIYKQADEPLKPPENILKRPTQPRRSYNDGFNNMFKNNRLINIGSWRANEASTYNAAMKKFEQDEVAYNAQQQRFTDEDYSKNKAIRDNKIAAAVAAEKEKTRVNRANIYKKEQAYFTGLQDEKALSEFENLVPTPRPKPTATPGAVLPAVRADLKDISLRVASPERSGNARPALPAQSTTPLKVPATKDAVSPAGVAAKKDMGSGSKSLMTSGGK